MSKENKIIYGIYGDEEVLLSAVKEARERHYDIQDVYSPFPVHGLDPLLGLAESRLHIAGFVFGAIGTLTAFLGMTWIFTKDWPIIFGGKPYWSVPAFIPITFELTVLFASIGMVVSFYVVSGLGPGVKSKLLDRRLTDDKFCISFENSENSDYEEFFRSTGAEEVGVA